VVTVVVVVFLVAPVYSLIVRVGWLPLLRISSQRCFIESRLPWSSDDGGDFAAGEDAVDDGEEGDEAVDDDGEEEAEERCCTSYSSSTAIHDAGFGEGMI